MDDLDMKNNIKLDVLISQACVVLRDVFRKRWQIIYNEDWENVENRGNILINGLAKHIYKKAKNRQRLAMQNGNLDHFDIATLCPLIIASNAFDTTKTDQEMRQKIFDITKVINKLAHPVLEVMKVTEFKKLWQKLSDALIYFGFSETILNAFYWSDIGDLYVENQRTISDENNILANQLKKKAETAFQQNKIEQSIELYSNALNLNGLSDYILVVLYVNRSAAYLKLTKTNENNEMAKDDAKCAVQCSPPWWKSYYMLGCSYDAALKHLKAIESYEKALTLDPNQSEIRTARNCCRNWLSVLDSKEHVETEPQMSERRLRRNNCFKKLIISISSVNLKIMSIAMVQLRQLGNETLVALSEALEDVYLAHCYIAQKNGVKKNFKKAAQLFARAAKSGNPEAIYNLAMLTLSGKGVRRKISSAINLLDEAAHMPTINAFNFPNFGVAESQYGLGLCYDDGIGVKKNLQIAANWYTQSSNNGCSEASNNLAILYAEGQGVFKNVKRAVLYWKLAAFRGNVLAMESLEDYYLAVKDMKQAKHWWKSSLENGAHDQSEKHELYSNVEDLEVDECDEDIESICKNLGTDLLYGINTNLLPNCDNIFSGTIDMSSLAKSAREGSKTAENLWKAFNHFTNAVDSFVNNNNVVTAKMVHEFAEGIRAEHIVGKWELEVLRNLPAIIEENLKFFSLQPPTPFESDLRIVYICLQSDETNLEELLQFIKASIERFPDENFLYDMYQSVLGYLQLYYTGLESATESLKKFPNDLNILYNQAILTRLANKGTKKVIDACKMLLNVAPIDHYKVPELYFVIASCHLLEKNIKLCCHFYNKGIDMEKEQLSCFLPYNSITKKCIADVLKIMKENDLTFDTQQHTEMSNYVESKEKTAKTSKVVSDSKEGNTKTSASASNFREKNTKPSGSKGKATITSDLALATKEKTTKTSDLASSSKKNKKNSCLASDCKQTTKKPSEMIARSIEENTKTSDLPTTTKASVLASTTKGKSSNVASGSNEKTANTSHLASDRSDTKENTTDIVADSKEKKAKTLELDSGSKEINTEASGLASGSKEKSAKTSHLASDTKEKTTDIVSDSKEKNPITLDLDSGSKEINTKASGLASGSKEKSAKTSHLASDTKEQTTDIVSDSKEKNPITLDLDSGSKEINVKALDLASGPKEKGTKTSGSKGRNERTSNSASGSKKRNRKLASASQGKAANTSDSSVTTLKIDDKFQLRKVEQNEARHTFTHTYRVRLIVEHRQKVVATSGNDGTCGLKLRKCATVPKFNQDLIGFKPFRITEMDIMKNRLYNGYVLKALSIDHAVIDNPIRLLISDENCCIVRCSIYNFNGSAETIQEKLGFGSTFSIINPCVKIASDKIPGIRIDDPRFIIHLTTSDNRCRFCFQVGENGERCDTCNIGYCSRECKADDWVFMKHGLTCTILKTMGRTTDKVPK